MGLGEATSNAKLADVGADELGRITGQKAVVRRATKSIAQFKLRQGMPVGAMVTLRGERMYEFLDRLISIALPRVRDFRGVSPKGFDGRGNFTLGLRDQLLFPEIDYMKVDKARGMNVSVVTSARTDEEARKLLQLMGMPFRTNQSSRSRSPVTVGRSRKRRLRLGLKTRTRTRGYEWPRLRRSPRKRRLRSTRFVHATAASCAAARVPSCGSFDMCRLCFRKLALEGDVTGVTKSSW